MKDITEMTLEELQDYTLDLTNQIGSKDTEIAQITAKNEELDNLNKSLQKRNNELFFKLNQQTTPTINSQGDEEPPTPSCEEFATNKYKEIL